MDAQSSQVKWAFWQCTQALVAFFFLDPFLLVVGESPGVSVRLRLAAAILFPDDDDDVEDESSGEIASVVAMAGRLGWMGCIGAESMTVMGT